MRRFRSAFRINTYGRPVRRRGRWRARFGQDGDFLFGRFGIADAMFAPVVLRFQTYGVALEGAARDYADAVRALPALQAWVADAVAETERIGKYEREA